jgi:membrane associated rhomboid family serine protease
MNKNIFKDVVFKVFRSGNPMFLYIGINTILFVLVAIIGLVFFLANKAIDTNLLVRTYFGLPALLSALPAKFYTIFTYMFFHDGLLHLLFNMLWLFWFGNIFMNFLKVKQFHFIYIAGGLLGAVFFLAGLNIFPVFASELSSSTVVGSSAAVMAIIVATATLVPNYTLQLMFFGLVKIKYLAIAYFVFDFISIASANAGGSLAHIGGALLGFVFIKQLQKGNDWSKIFDRKPKLKVVKNDNPIKKTNPNTVSQQEIDAILDKISSSGYDKLSSSEKEKLFKASKN